MSNLLSMLLSSTTQGLMWAVMAIGIYIMYRILDIADLSAEGTFPVGAATCAQLIYSGMDPVLATLIAMVAGMGAGMVSGLLHTKLKIPALLTGILTMTGLYSINLRIMGKGNLPLLVGKGGEPTVSLVSIAKGIAGNFGVPDTYGVLVLGLLVVIIVTIILFFFFNTELGLAIRATGDNPDMAEANTINVDWMKIISYMLSNGLIALSGALMAQANGYADISMGVGTIVIGLASIIIGEVFFKNLSLTKRLMTIVIGAIVYRFIIALVLDIPWFDPQDLKLFSALILTIALASPAIREWTQKLGGKKNVN